MNKALKARWGPVAFKIKQNRLALKVDLELLGPAELPELQGQQALKTLRERLVHRATRALRGHRRSYYG